MPGDDRKGGTGSECRWAVRSAISELEGPNALSFATIRDAAIVPKQHQGPSAEASDHGIHCPAAGTDRFRRLRPGLGWSGFDAVEGSRVPAGGNLARMSRDLLSGVPRKGNRTAVTTGAGRADGGCDLGLSLPFELVR